MNKYFESSSDNSEDEFSSNECESNRKIKKNYYFCDGKRLTSHSPLIAPIKTVVDNRVTSSSFTLHTLKSHNCTYNVTDDHSTSISIDSNTFLKQSLNTIQFSRSSVGGSKYLMNATPSSDDNSDLMFESRFESGNLAKVIKVTPVYYELYLRPDLYTNKHTQWFYFRVTNTRKKLTYRYVLVDVPSNNIGHDDST